MKIVYKRSAEKEILSFDKPLAQRIFKKIDLLKDSPQPHGSQKVEDGYRIRIGDYRVVYTINYQNQIITIMRIRHRRDVYR